MGSTAHRLIFATVDDGRSLLTPIGGMSQCPMFAQGRELQMIWPVLA